MNNKIKETLEQIQLEEELILHFCEYNSKRWSYLMGTKLTDDYVFATPHRLQLTDKYGLLIYSLHEISTGTIVSIESKCKDLLSML